MERITIDRHIIEIIAFEMNILPKDIKSTDKLGDDLGIDSLDEIMIIMEIEEAYMLDFPNVEIMESGVVTTVQDVIDLTKKHIKGEIKE